MNIKLPFCGDVSHWKEIPDFTKIDPRPAIFITKATEAYPGSGYNHTDDKFQRFMIGMMEIGCIRGAYHFFRKSLDARQQAEHFLNIISKIDILPSDLLILDVEEGGEKASQLWQWFETVKKAYANTLMIYSRKNILDPIPMTTGEKEYFKKIWTWTAGYPWFPDLYSVCPAGYIPNQDKFGPVGLWQYGKRLVDGIDGDTDVNWINPIFLQQIGTPEIGELITMNYTGTCKTLAKVFETVGGLRIYPDVRVGQVIAADGKQGEYLHLTSPVRGWSKAIWFDYREVTTPPPPPPPVEEYVLHVKNGVTRKFIPE